MKRVITFDWITEETMTGFGVMIAEKGHKNKVLMDGDKPASFDKRKDAKQYGVDFINSEKVKQQAVKPTKEGKIYLGDQLLS